MKLAGKAGAEYSAFVDGAPRCVPEDGQPAT